MVYLAKEKLKLILIMKRKIRREPVEMHFYSILKKLKKFKMPWDIKIKIKSKKKMTIKMKTWSKLKRKKNLI